MFVLNEKISQYLYAPKMFVCLFVCLLEIEFSCVYLIQDVCYSVLCDIFAA